MLCKLLPACSKFKFCFLELSENFLKNILNMWLVESMDTEPEASENQLYILLNMDWDGEHM